MSAEHQYYTSSHCFYCGESIVSTTDASQHICEEAAKVMAAKRAEELAPGSSRNARRMKKKLARKHK